MYWFWYNYRPYRKNQGVKMMVFQEIVDSMRSLSVQEQDNLIELIRQQREQQQGNKFWQGLQELRATLQREEIYFDDDDFADLRDRSPGREVNL
jgi:cysteinyl-tRNA synthetase